jgi:hypothetical protein
VRPGHQAPDLELPLVGGGSLRLRDRRPDNFVMVVFNRGLHCPVCQAQLRELDRRFEEVSRGISEAEPAVFNGPALFLLKPDGSVYYVSLLSMPVGRPRLDDLLAGIEYWAAHDYPARGEA